MSPEENLNIQRMRDKLEEVNRIIQTCKKEITETFASTGSVNESWTKLYFLNILKQFHLLSELNRVSDKKTSGPIPYGVGSIIPSIQVDNYQDLNVALFIKSAIAQAKFWTLDDLWFNEAVTLAQISMANGKKELPKQYKMNFILANNVNPELLEKKLAKANSSFYFFLALEELWRNYYSEESELGRLFQFRAQECMIDQLSRFLQGEIPEDAFDLNYNYIVSTIKSFESFPENIGRLKPLISNNLEDAHLVSKAKEIIFRSFGGKIFQSLRAWHLINHPNIVILEGILRDDYGFVISNHYYHTNLVVVRT